MKELYPLRGIVTVLNTPFSNDGTIDTEGLKKNVDEALLAGVAGFLVPAMASEVYKLSEDERFKMVEVVLQRVNGKVPVFAGAGDINVIRSKKIIKKYIALGCKHLLFQIPYTDDQTFKKDFYYLAETGAECIMLQDWDANGYGLNDQLILELFQEVENFRCLKIETVPAGVKYSRILELTNGTLNVSSGWAVSQMLEGLKRGVHAFMPTGMHYIYTSIYDSFTRGEMKNAQKLFQEILPVLAFSNQHLDISIHFFKRLLYRQGIYSNPNVRSPILPFDALHASIAEEHIEKIICLENKLKEARNVNY